MYNPARICIDDLGEFYKSLLSGHIGGGNKATDMIAKELDAVAVITTATDINGRFSVDSFATEKGYKIESLKIAKDISAEILERDIPIYCDTEMTGILPKGLIAYMSDKESSRFKLGISVSARKKKPFESTLLLIPKVLSVGIGCRRGTTKEQIALAVKTAFETNGLDIRAIKSISSIDVKRD